MGQSSQIARRTPETTELEEFPGHQIRRLQQIAVAIFLQETEPYGLTPVQCAAMISAGNGSGMDQRTLARTIGFDTSTIAGVIDSRCPSPLDHTDGKRARVARERDAFGDARSAPHACTAFEIRARGVHADAGQIGGYEQRFEPGTRGGGSSGQLG